MAIGVRIVPPKVERETVTLRPGVLAVVVLRVAAIDRVAVDIENEIIVARRRVGLFEDIPCVGFLGRVRVSLVVVDQFVQRFPQPLGTRSIHARIVVRRTNR